MGSKYTKRYAEEFKRDAVALVASSGRVIDQIMGRESGISESMRARFHVPDAMLKDVARKIAEAIWGLRKRPLWTQARTTTAEDNDEGVR